MEIRHADLQIEVEDAEDGGVLLTLTLPWFQPRECQAALGQSETYPSAPANP